MQSHFVINVSKNGRFFFATSEHSAVSAKEATVLADEMMKRFPAKEGFEVSVSYERHIGFCHYGTVMNEQNSAEIIKSLYGEAGL